MNSVFNLFDSADVLNTQFYFQLHSVFESFVVSRVNTPHVAVTFVG